MTRINALHNCSNPYQGQYKKVLCVCSAGLLRSPTTAIVLQRTYNYNTRACGVHDYALIQFDDVLGTWADEIVCVEQSIANNIPDQFKDKVITLNIPDRYEYMNPELQEIIKEQYDNALRNSRRTD